MILYYFIFESVSHRTLGKYVTNTKVVMQNGDEPSPRAILLRSLCRLIPFDAFSFLGRDGKGWHDSLSNTYVVDSKLFDSKLKMSIDLEQLGQ